MLSGLWTKYAKEKVRTGRVFFPTARFFAFLPATEQKNTPFVLFNPLRAVRQARFGNTFSTTLGRLSLLGVTLGGLEMQLSGPKTDFGAQGAP